MLIQMVKGAVLVTQWVLDPSAGILHGYGLPEAICQPSQSYYVGVYDLSTGTCEDMYLEKFRIDTVRYETMDADYNGDGVADDSFAYLCTEHKYEGRQCVGGEWVSADHN